MQLVERISRSVRRASRALAERDRTTRGRAATVVVCLLAGFMISASALASAGNDLRPNRSTDLVDLVRAEAARSKDLASQVAELRGEVDQLSKEASRPGQDYAPQVAAAATDANLQAVKGPGVQVTLNDAPLDVKPPGVAGDLLVVHQQDIQAVVNALWTGGAEAMSIQGVRVTSTTGIKCVGNSVVLKGVPYAPPYVIVAIGDPARLQGALATDPAVQIYQQYVASYQLGYDQRRLAEVTIPGFVGSTELKYASPVK